MKYRIILFIFAITLIFSPKAHAYINPGTGSYFFQVLAGFFMGIVFFFRNILREIRNFFVKSDINQEKDYETDN